MDTVIPQFSSADQQKHPTLSTCRGTHLLAAYFPFTDWPIEPTAIVLYLRVFDYPSCAPLLSPKVDPPKEDSSLVPDLAHSLNNTADLLRCTTPRNTGHSVENPAGDGCNISNPGKIHRNLAKESSPISFEGVLGVHENASSCDEACARATTATTALEAQYFTDAARQSRSRLAAPPYAAIDCAHSNPLLNNQIESQHSEKGEPDASRDKQSASNEPQSSGFPCITSSDDAAEPLPAYSEGESPIPFFAYIMAAAGGASSIITQVQQGAPSLNALGDVGVDEIITMDLRGTRFVLSRDELLTLPEFVLLSLFPNGLFTEGHMGMGEQDCVQVDYDPTSLNYMLEFFRDVAQSIPLDYPQDAASGTLRDDLHDDASRRAGIIVLREDLDFYIIPPRTDVSHPEMLQVKRSAAQVLLKQDGIFSGLKRSDEPGTTEAHLIEMLTAGGFNHNDSWGHRAGEPNKAVISSLALARLRSDVRPHEVGSHAAGMAQKLLLFWRKPARRCWWEGVELENVEGVEGKLKVWIRRVWTLEVSMIGLR